MTPDNQFYYDLGRIQGRIDELTKQLNGGMVLLSSDLEQLYAMMKVLVAKKEGENE